MLKRIFFFSASSLLYFHFKFAHSLLCEFYFVYRTRQWMGMKHQHHCCKSCDFRFRFCSLRLSPSHCQFLFSTISALFLLLWLIKSIMLWDQNDSLMLLFFLLRRLAASVCVNGCAHSMNVYLNSSVEKKHQMSTLWFMRIIHSLFNDVIFFIERVCVWLHFDSTRLVSKCGKWSDGGGEDGNINFCRRKG